MNQGIISKEFYIGRYIYLTEQLARLPIAVFNRVCNYNGIAIWTIDKQTGKKVRVKRLTENNPEYSRYSEIALKRAHLEEQLKITLNNWSKDYRGNLTDIAAGYVIVPNTDNVYSSAFWSRLNNNSNSYEQDRKVMHNSIMMRSQFEADVANILEELGIDYKYEVELLFNSKDRYYPDFSLNFPEYNRCGFLEALGGMDNFGYVGHNAKKLNTYFNAGLYPNRDIAFIAGDLNYRPDYATMKRIIGVMCDAFARQYVLKKIR